MTPCPPPPTLDPAHTDNGQLLAASLTRIAALTDCNRDNRQRFLDWRQYHLDRADD